MWCVKGEAPYQGCWLRLLPSSGALLSGQGRDETAGAADLAWAVAWKRALRVGDESLYRRVRDASSQRVSRNSVMMLGVRD